MHSRHKMDHGRKPEQEPSHRSGDTPPGDDAVARRAYQRFEARGFAHGRDMEDWLEAERELRRGEQAGREAEPSSRTGDGSNEAA